MKVEGLRKAVAILARMPRVIGGAVLGAFKIHGKQFERDFVQRRLSSGAPPGRAKPGALASRTGALRRNFRVRVVGAPQDPDSIAAIAEIGKNAPYATVHEYGAEGSNAVRSSRPRGFLAIPVGPARTRAGANPVGPRDIPDLFPVTSKAGSLLLVKRVGKGIQPWFVLKRSVSIPARLNLRKDWLGSRVDAATTMVAQIGGALTRLFSRGGRGG